MVLHLCWDWRSGACALRSRHGTDLTPRLGSLLAPFEAVAPGTTFDGELVAIGERGGQPTQDFAAVTRAVFTGKPLATNRLRLVVFDLLCVGGEDLRPRPWEERDALLHDALPASDRIRLVASQPANPTAHDAIVALGFEGTVVKRTRSAYRAGRHTAWLKHKARFTTRADLRRSARTVRADGTRCAMSTAAVSTRSLAAALRSSSGSPSSSSTRGWMPTEPSARRASRPQDPLPAAPKTGSPVGNASARAAAHVPYSSVTVAGAGQSPSFSRSTASRPRPLACVRDQSYEDGGRP